MTNIEKNPRQNSPILQASSISGRTLSLSIAIMSFLCALTIGCVDLMMQSALTWQSQVAREVTVQLKPLEGRNMEEDLRKTLEILRQSKGVSAASALSEAQSAKLLEPWVGNASLLKDLPLPRLISVQYQLDNPPDGASLQAKITAAVPHALLDDHKQPQQRMRKMANSFIILGLGLVIVMILATLLTVVFATRATIATAHNVLEVLHFVGAKDAFIARLFERRFLTIGLQGAAFGGLATAFVFLTLYISFSTSKTAAATQQMEVLFGTFQPSLWGLVSMLAILLFIALMSAITTRITVMKSLSDIA
jgi:cell division transport system permease protein